MSRKVEDQARWLADKFASQDKKIAGIQSRTGLEHSSIEDGAIVEKDLDGNLVASVGKQHDGSHVAVPYTGPIPAAPVAASLKAVPGVVEVRWSGKFTGDSVSAMDFKHVSVHVSTTPAVDATPNTQVATIRGELGDVATVTAVEGMLYVVLVAWSTAGKASAPSPVAAVAVPGAVDEEWIQGKLDDIDERYDGVITDAGTLGTRLSTAEVVLTSAQDRLTGAESDITDAFGQISTVDGKAGDAAAAASSAQGKADTAKSAADAANAEIALIPAKIETAKQAAIDAAALVAQTKANAAESAAKTAAASDAKTKADAAQAAAIAAAKTASDLSAAGAKSEAIAAATADAKTKADAAQAAAIAAAALDATAKAAQAKTDATTIAANDATAKANSAKADAIAAASLDATAKAGLAKTDAIASATTMTNGIGKNLSSTAVPTTFNTAPQGSMWRRTDGSGRIIGVWEQTGAGVAGTWTPRLITSETIDNLDVGKLSSSTAAISTLVSQKIAAAVGVFLALDVGQLTVTGSSTMAEAVINKLWTEVVHSRMITADMVLIGSGLNVIPDPNFSSAGIAAAITAQSNGTWVVDADGNLASTNLGTGNQYMRPTGVGQSQAAIAGWIKVQPGESYRLTVTAVTTGTGDLRVTYRGGLNGAAVIAPTPPQNKTFTSGQLCSLVAKVPAGVYYMLPEIRFNGVTSAKVLGGTLTCCRMNGGELTVDGTVTARALETELVLTTDVIAGNPLGTHAKLNANGIRVMASTDGSAPTEVVRLGTDTDDYIGVVDPATGNLSAAINSTGDISGQSLAIANQITLGGEDLGERIRYMPQRLVTWGQVPINADTMKLNPTGTEIGLFEIGWDSSQPEGADARMYEFNVNQFLAMSTVAGIIGLRLRVTTDGSAPTVNSPILGMQYVYCMANNYASLHANRIFGSNNGAFTRILVSLYNGTSGTVTLLANSPGVQYLYSSVKDLGGTSPGLAQASSGGGSQGGAGTVAPPPVNPAVTVTRDFNTTGTRSFIGSGATYAYNTGYMYSGLSPSGYGDLSSMAVFQSFTSLLSGATVNDIWVYVYYDFWYQGSGGTAQISLHGQAALTSTKPAISGAVTVANWPRATGKWVRLPDSTYAGFKSGGWKGIALGGGGGGYERYGYAHDPKIRIRYTK